MSSSTASKLQDVFGLDSAKRAISRIAVGDTGVHAVLLYGHSGSGREQLAEILAQAWLCREPSSDGADGTCRACGAYSRGSSADILRIAPQGASSILGLKQITNDNPREDEPVPLRTFFRTGPLMSRHKVAILTDAHRMNGDAANSLLKTLEEPFPHAKLILTTPSIGEVLPTILSRCLCLACSLPPHEELRQRFPTATEDDLRLSEGAPEKLKKILEKPERFRAVAEFARALKKRAPIEALAASEELRKIAEKLEPTVSGGARAANAETLALLATFLAREPDIDPRWPQWVIESHRRILQNGSSGLVFDAMFARMLRTNRKG